MKEASPVIANSTRADAKYSRGSYRLTDPGPSFRSVLPVLRDRPDELRLKAALKRAVERDLAPQTLIDVIKNKIRNTDELQ